MCIVIKTGEAKARLSKHLVRVEIGEEITIAHGDVPVAHSFTSHNATMRVLPLPVYLPRELDWRRQRPMS